MRLHNAGSVAHQPAVFGIFARGIRCGDRVARRQQRQLQTPVGEKGIAEDQERVGPLALKTGKGGIDLVRLCWQLRIPDLQALGAGGRFRAFQLAFGNRSIGWIDEHGNTGGGGHQFAQELFKGVLSDEVVEAIEAPLPDDILELMLNGPISQGGGK